MRGLEVRCAEQISQARITRADWSFASVGSEGQGSELDAHAHLRAGRNSSPGIFYVARFLIPQDEASFPF